MNTNYYVQCYDGTLFDFDVPSVDMIKIENIAHQLSFENRWLGATRFPYSVAQHSLLVCQFAPDEFKLEGLLHDAEEFMTKDFPSPMLRMIRENTSIIDEIRFEVRGLINEKFQLKYEGSRKVIKEIDLRAAKTERDQLFINPQKCHDDIENSVAYNYEIIEKSWRVIEQQFLNRFNELRRD